MGFNHSIVIQFFLHRSSHGPCPAPLRWARSNTTSSWFRGAFNEKGIQRGDSHSWKTMEKP